MKKALKVTGIVAAGLVLLGIGSACGTGSTPAAYHTPSGQGITTVPAQPAVAPSSQAPLYTPAQQQALDAAVGYLTDGQGFSKAGLMSQLHSPYGNGFSRSLARWAVSQVSSPGMWRRQAVIAAKGYLSDGQGFSYDSLVQQLDSPYGGQFTYGEAVYAARKAGL